MAVKLQFLGYSISLNIKNLDFSKQQPEQNRASRHRQRDTYAVFGVILYIYTECKWIGVAQSA